MRYASLIIRGKGRGRALGFPTINFRIPRLHSGYQPDKIILAGGGQARALDLPHGIYAGYVWIGLPRLLGGRPKGRGERQFRAAFHYGPIPTFHSPAPSLEAFVLDAPHGFRLPRSSGAAGKGRGKPQRAGFELIAYLREIKKFPSRRKLSQAIRADVRRASAILLPPPRNHAG